MSLKMYVYRDEVVFAENAEAGLVLFEKHFGHNPKTLYEMEQSDTVLLRIEPLLGQTEFREKCSELGLAPDDSSVHLTLLAHAPAAVWCEWAKKVGKEFGTIDP